MSADTKYLGMTRNAAFEKAVREAVAMLIPLLEPDVTDAVKLRYITHVFACQLDEAATLLLAPHKLN